MSKFDETIEKLKKEYDELEETVKEKYEQFDEAAKPKAEELVKKTQAAIQATIDKVQEAVKDLKEDEKVDEFLDSVQTKSQEAVDYTKAKIEEFANSGAKESLDKIYQDIMADFEKIKETDQFKKVSDFANAATDKVKDYLNKPEVQEALDKAKKTTIKVAEKGVEGLKKVLNAEEDKK